MNVNTIDSHSDSSPDHGLTRDAPPRRSKPNVKRRRWVRRALTALAGLALLGALVVAARPKPEVVETRVVARGPMRITVDEAGKTRVKDRYVISAPLAGEGARIALRPGDEVGAGDVLDRIVPMQPPLLDARTRTEAEARLAAASAGELQAKSAVERARLAEERARVDVDQNQRLAVDGAVTADALDRAILEQRLRAQELASARFAALVADHEVDVARASLRRLKTPGRGDELEVTSPVAGRVLRVMQESAGVVQVGAPLVEVGDPSALEVVSDVLTSDAVHIAAGARVSLEEWGGDRPLAGHVRRIEPSAFTRLSALGIEEQRVNVVIDLDDAPAAWKRLGDGYRVEARIEVWQADDVLSVASSAVFRQGDRWCAFQVVNGVARLETVEVGRRAATDVQITKGLEEGAVVIVHPSDTLTDGARVASR